MGQDNGWMIDDKKREEVRNIKNELEELSHKILETETNVFYGEEEFGMIAEEYEEAKLKFDEIGKEFRLQKQMKKDRDAVLYVLKSKEEFLRKQIANMYETHAEAIAQEVV